MYIRDCCSCTGTDAAWSSFLRRSILTSHLRNQPPSPYMRRRRVPYMEKTSSLVTNQHKGPGWWTGATREPLARQRRETYGNIRWPLGTAVQGPVSRRG